MLFILNVVIADGMLKEFEIAKSLGKIIIPVGITGGATSVIYDKVKQDIEQFPYLSESFELLGTETDWSKLVDIICEIINKQQVI